MKSSCLPIYSILTGLLLFYYSGSMAQTPMVENLWIAPTPQAADLGRFGDIPMSYYTGRANVTIPIYSFTERGVTLDINLSYDTSGLLMHKLPGWVGPSWSLNAGGCITRVQNNFSDEMERSYEEGVSLVNYFDACTDLNYLPNQLNYNQLEANSLFKDYSPDYFYFNFMGKTGKFFLGTDKHWKVCSDDNLIVEFDVEDSSNYTYPLFSTFPKAGAYGKQPKAIRGFVMYDDEGNKYTFGYSRESVEYSTDFFHASDDEEYVPWIATCWYLTKVEDRFGNQLYSLSYQRGKFTAQFYRTYYEEEVSQTDLGNHQSWQSVTNYYTGTLHSPIYLTSIQTLGHGSATFWSKNPYPAGNAARRLYPSLYNGNDALNLSEYVSHYGYYPFYYLQCNIDSVMSHRVSNTNLLRNPLSALDFRLLDYIDIQSPASPKCIWYSMEYDSLSRMHLSGVKIHTSVLDDSILCHYKFRYNNYASVPDDYLTDIYDHWGYHNHSQNGTSTLEGCRAPDFSRTLLGSLSEIIYPTGGKSVFEYELNDYSSVLSSDRQNMLSEQGQAGGLRIKSITEYSDSTNNNLLKRRQFFYTDPQTGLSSGQLFKKPAYFWQWTNGQNSKVVIQSIGATKASCLPPRQANTEGHNSITIVLNRPILTGIRVTLSHRLMS